MHSSYLLSYSVFQIISDSNVRSIPVYVYLIDYLLLQECDSFWEVRRIDLHRFMESNWRSLKEAGYCVLLKNLKGRHLDLMGCIYVVAQSTSFSLHLPILNQC